MFLGYQDKEHDYYLVMDSVEEDNEWEYHDEVIHECFDDEATESQSD